MKRTPDLVKCLKEEAESLTNHLIGLARKDGTVDGTALASVVGFLRKAEKHLDGSDAEGYYEEERHLVHLDVAAAYAALAKAGARAIAARLEPIPDPPESS